MWLRPHCRPCCFRMGRRPTPSHCLRPLPITAARSPHPAGRRRRRGDGPCVNAATARAAANVVRLSVIYALLDCADTIRPEHLRAALAVWQYCEASARFVFGGQESDPVQQKIIENLKTGSMTQTQINDLFGGHVSTTKLREKLEMLSAKGRIGCRDEKTATRTRKEWFFVK